jgi:hypothetical protein
MSGDYDEIEDIADKTTVHISRIHDDGVELRGSKQGMVTKHGRRTAEGHRPRWLRQLAATKAFKNRRK